MRIFKKSFVAPVAAGGFRAASRSGNCLCAKGLRRRFKTPKKYFSGELSNWPNLALFETAASAKPPLFQGVRNTRKRMSPIAVVARGQGASLIFRLAFHAALQNQWYLFLAQSRAQARPSVACVVIDADMNWQ